MKLIEFYTTWCSPCKIQKPIVESLVKDLNISVDFVDIDEKPEMAAQYGVRAVPTIVILTDSGEVKKKLVGLQPASVLKEELK
jgi:thioredoxin 1